MGLFPSMDYFGGHPAREPKRGIARYFQLLWDHLGKLLLTNFLCAAGFLPLALLCTLGLIYENFWLCLLGGALGGGIAGAVWTAQLALSFLLLDAPSCQWFGVWRQILRKKWCPAALQGAVFGAVLGALLNVGNFALGLSRQEILPAPAVWLLIGLDFFLWSMAANGMFFVLSLEDIPLLPRIKMGLKLAAGLPVRCLLGATALLCVMLSAVMLFPVSVPYMSVFGFSPLALLLAQLLAPAWKTQPSSLQQAAMAADASQRLQRQRRSVFIQKYRAVLAAGLFLGAFALSFWHFQLRTREPDFQIAVVHREALPDSVREALEKAFSQLVGDRNGDGIAYVIVNDYTVVLDGTATDANQQAAGMTQLVTDLAGKISGIYIAEDAQAFENRYSDQVTKAGIWREHPVLAALDAGSYSTVLKIDQIESGQDLLAFYGVFRADWLETQPDFLAN